MKPKVLTLGIVLPVCLLFSGAAFSQDGAASAGLEPVSGGNTSAAQAMASLGFLGEDLFLNLSVGAAFTFDKIAFGLHAPLRLRIWDRAPEEESGGLIRREDWDEWTEWSRILRFFEYGKPRDMVHVRVGELVAATLGHGTIVHRYYNTLDIDHYHTGLWANLNLDSWGASLLTNDLLGPQLLAARGYVRPFKLAGLKDQPLLDAVVVGLTLAMDIDAPWELQLNPRGLAQVDSSGMLVYDSRVAVLWGWDVAWEVIRTQSFDLTPYMDFNFLAASGFGWHPGVMSRFTPMEKVELEWRLEARLLTARYAPSYFNTFYDFERLRMPSAEVGYLSWRHWNQAPGLDARAGFFGEVYANLFNFIGLGGAWEDYQGPDNGSVMLRAELPYILNFKLSGYYAKRNFDGFSELFDRDQALLVTQARYRLGIFYVFANYSLQWELDRNALDVEDKYHTIDDFRVGVGLEATF